MTDGTGQKAPVDEVRDRARPVRWLPIIGAVVVVSVVLAFIPNRTDIPPVLGSDYCYQLTAADRLVAGHGLTATPPVAPHQPWTWRADWAFLTNWPCGYSLLVAGVGYTFGQSTVAACGWISVVACAASLVGWFVWVRRCVPRGMAGILLAAVAAGCSVSTAVLVNPSTDALFVAALPFALLLASRGVELARAGDESRNAHRATLLLATAGLAAGGLFWIRYASLFVPAAIGLYLLIELCRTSNLTFRHAASFATGAAVPIVALVVINRTLGVAGSAQAQLNLGQSIGFDFSLSQVATAWWKLTDFGFYNYHAFTHWVYACWPVILIVVAACVPACRRNARTFVASPAVGLSAITLLALPAMLITATTLFSGKFDYVGLDRYYVPAKPLYFVLFAAPMLLVPVRSWRVCACGAMLVASSWLIQQEWPRPYHRWLAADYETTPWGQRAICFTPNSGALHEWLQEQADDGLVVVSNYHEYLALETNLPVLPIPPDRKTLDDWIERIRESRQIDRPRVLFVLDPDNRWRSYWIEEPSLSIERFALTPLPHPSTDMAAGVYQYAPAASTSTQASAAAPAAGASTP